MQSIIDRDGRHQAFTEGWPGGLPKPGSDSSAGGGTARGLAAGAFWRTTFEPGCQLGELGRLSQRPEGAIKQLGLGLHQSRGVLERAAGRFERLGLSAQHLTALLDEVEDGVDRGEHTPSDLPLQRSLALDDLLQELDLPLHRFKQLSRNLGASAHGRRRRHHGVHQLAPFA